MLRGLLIVICSWSLCGSGLAGVALSTGQPNVFFYAWQERVYRDGSISNVFNPSAWNTTNSFNLTTNSVFGSWVNDPDYVHPVVAVRFYIWRDSYTNSGFSKSNPPVFELPNINRPSAENQWFWGGLSNNVATQGTNVVLQGITNSVPDPVESTQFSWTFGAEYSGAFIEVKDASGETVVAFLVPEGGGVWTGSVSGESLVGYYVTIDGVNAAELAVAALQPDTGAFNVERGNYNFTFDSTYQGYQWEARRTDGSVAASGSAASMGTALSGSLTLGPGDSAEVYVRAPSPGDGVPSSWVPSGVTIQGGSTTSQAFVQATLPELEQPSPPAPTIPDFPAAGSGTNTYTTNFVTNNIPADELINVTVPEAEVPSTDVGQETVIEKATELTDKIAEGYEDFAEAFNNVAMTFGEFRKIVLSPPGSNCTFQMGGVTVDVGQYVPSFVRSASILVFLFAAVIAIKNMLWETFK